MLPILHRGRRQGGASNPFWPLERRWPRGSSELLDDALGGVLRGALGGALVTPWEWGGSNFSNFQKFVVRSRPPSRIMTNPRRRVGSFRLPKNLELEPGPNSFENHENKFSVNICFGIADAIFLFHIRFYGRIRFQSCSFRK